NAEKKAARYEEYRARLAAASAALQSHDVTSAEHQLELAPRELHGWEWDHLHSRLDDSFNVLRPATGERPSLLNTPQGIRVVWIAPNSLRVTDEQGSECAALSSRLFSGLLEWAWVNPQRGDVLVVTVDEHQNVLVIDEAGRIRLRANG